MKTKNILRTVALSLGAISVSESAAQKHTNFVIIQK